MLEHIEQFFQFAHHIRFFLQTKASNKATLETVVTVGPITIDLSPPVYNSGLSLETGTTFILTWPATAFSDTEDTALLTEYQWALGMCSVLF